MAPQGPFPNEVEWGGHAEVPSRFRHGPQKDQQVPMVGRNGGIRFFPSDKFETIQAIVFSNRFLSFVDDF